MPKTVVLGIEINDPSIQEILLMIDKAIEHNDAIYFATVNSEILQLGLQDPAFKQVLKSASLRLCDGIGVQWAAAFNARRYPTFINILRLPFSLARLLIQPSSARRAIRHRITGRLLFEDILAHAATHNHSVFLLGGGEGVAEQVKTKAEALYPKLTITGTFGGSPEEGKEVLQAIKSANILFVAYGAPRQELFIRKHLAQMQVNVAIGVGGTFDAFVGAKPIGSAFRQLRPPRWVHRWGLESFWRLVTQPNRYKRVLRSIVGLAVRVALSRENSNM